MNRADPQGREDNGKAILFSGGEDSGASIMLKDYPPPGTLVNPKFDAAKIKVSRCTIGLITKINQWCT
jgi:hypothetical protein